MRISLFILLAVLLTACGQKGPLFLPEENNNIERPSVENHEQDPLKEKKSTEVSE